MHWSHPTLEPCGMSATPLYQQSHQSEVTVSSVMAEQSLLAVGPTSTRQRFTTNLSIVMAIISFQSVTYKNLVGVNSCGLLPWARVSPITEVPRLSSLSAPSNILTR